MTAGFVYLSLCWFCKHFDSSRKVVPTTAAWALKTKEQHFDVREDEDYLCTAFPEGIPPLILGHQGTYRFTNFPQFDHREPIGLDNGITFTLADLVTLKQRPPFINHSDSTIEMQYAETLDFINIGRLQGHVLPTKKSVST
jgi:hypothetical protein